mgnify:FL=1
MENTLGNTFVERIDGELVKQNLKRTSFAKIVGVTNQAFTDWKRRGTIPAADIVLRIADALNVDFRWLITGEEKNSFAPAQNLPPSEIISLAEDIFRLPSEYQEIIKNNVEAYKSLCYKLEKASTQNIG